MKTYEKHKAKRQQKHNKGTQWTKMKGAEGTIQKIRTTVKAKGKRKKHKAKGNGFGFGLCEYS